jgi:PAS domain S-box-containing protein
MVMRNRKGTAAPIRAKRARLPPTRLALRALDAGEERFRTAFAHTAIGLAITSTGGRFLHANPAYCSITGYSEPELKATHRGVITHPADLERYLHLVRRMLAGEIPGFVIEKRYLRKDGTVVWVENSVSLSRGRAPARSRIVTLSQDVTERKRGAESLRIHAVRQEVLAALGQRAIIARDPEALMEEVVARAAETLGLALCAVVELLAGGRELLRRAGVGCEGLPARTAVVAGHESLAGLTLRSDKPVVVRDLRSETRFAEPKLLERGLLSGMTALIRGRQGPFGVLVGLADQPRDFGRHDVDFLRSVANLLALAVEHHEIEVAQRRELRDSELRFRQLAEAINEVFWLGNPSSTEVLYISPAYEQVFGRSRQSLYLAPQSWFEAVLADDRERARRVFLAKAAGVAFDETYRIVRPDGSVRWIRSRGYPIRDAEGQVYRYAGVAQDVTDGKRIEEERESRVKQLQALADAALAIGAAGSLEEITRAVTESARQIIGAHQSVASLTVDEDWGQATHATSLSDRYAAYRAYDPKPGGSAVCRLVCQTNRPLRLTQTELEALLAAYGEETAGGHPPPRGWLAVPLVGRNGKNLGLIQLSDKYEAEFGEDDEAILVQLAQLASEAIDNASLLHEVTASHQRLEAMSRRLVNLQEEERRTIARELHDEVGQLLTGLKFMLEARERRGGEDLDPHRLTAVTVQLLERVRSLSRDLRPPMLDDLGLVPTLLWHFENYRAQTGIEVRFHHPGFAGRLPAETEIAAFRIIQEALTNVARYAGVAEARVELGSEEGRLVLRIQDAGRGFDPTAVAGRSSGLAGMGERARLLGGSLAIDSRPGGGTRLVAKLPLAGPG